MNEYPLLTAEISSIELLEHRIRRLRSRQGKGIASGSGNNSVFWKICLGIFVLICMRTLYTWLYNLNRIGIGDEDEDEGEG